MIFLTLGTMDMPFNRIVKLVDLAIEKGIIKENVFGQIGESLYLPRNFEYKKYLDKLEFDNKMKSCSYVISHAGMGSIIQSLQYRKAILIYPRLSKYGEHVNDHQLKTAIKFRDKNNIYVASDENDFFSQIEKIYSSNDSLFDNINQKKPQLSIFQRIYSEIENMNARIVVGASSGGHLTQLLRIISADDSREIEIHSYVTTLEIMREHLGKKGHVHIIGECNRNTPKLMLGVLLRAAKCAIKDKPDYVITTGALPLAFYCFFSRMLGAKIIWIDSIANVDEISLSGRFVRRFSYIFLTQWPHLAGSNQKIEYCGSVI